jgi:mono/diheme cytochrome c family protein
MKRQILIGLLGLLGMIPKGLQPVIAYAADDPERGLSIASQWCNSCHIVQQNDPGMDDGEIGPRFSTMTNQTAQALRQLLLSGHADMDTLSKLTERDAADIVAHLRRLKPEVRTPR